jgi:RHS repeat-associated protein
VLWARHCEPESPSWACFRAADPLKVSIDPNGNLTTTTEGSDTWAYTWNAETQLTKVEKNGVEVARFAYDPLGRRVEKVAGGVTTSYTYDRGSILRETRGGTVLRYTHGLGIDEPLAVDDGVALSYLHADGLGSVVKVTNASGAVTLTRQYDAWGNLETGASDSGYAFTGREWDADTGLYYYRARYYDARFGRFMSEDPIGLRGGVNLYAYVDSSPVGRTDPLGLQATSGSPKQGPCGRPYVPPKPGFWSRFLFGPPRVPNPCPDGAEPVSIDDSGPNPHTQYAAWVSWKNAFISCCEAQGQGYSARCPSEGMNQPGGEGQVSVCFCCKEKCKK